ncbi:MAG: hypothetical protein P4L83_15925 [Nevskia sp.]|nr:hypothetical protein [Nevskia sp.]
MAPHGLLVFLFAALLLYRLYRRYRSHIGPQRVQPRRMSLRVALMAAAVVALCALSMVPYGSAGNRRRGRRGHWLGAAEPASYPLRDA